MTDAFEREYGRAIEPYIGWLRQPVGWVVLATSACILLGVTLTPLALNMAAGLLALLAVGLIYPWLAVRLADCEIASQLAAIEEDQSHDVELRLRNRCLWPLCGLIVEGFVVHSASEAEAVAEPEADIALGYVPWLSQATYRLNMRPQMRGRYPVKSPQLTCAFPFGLWTARRTIEKVSPLVVYPKQLKLVGMFDQSGRSSHHCGNGSRAGGHGDFLGLRDYRVGDSIRHVHWAHTAKLDQLVICQRSAAEQCTWRIVLDVGNTQIGSYYSRENLAWRVRIASSFCALLHQQSIPFQLTIQGEELWNTSSTRDSDTRNLNQKLERLTDVPMDGLPPKPHSDAASRASECSLMITTVKCDNNTGKQQDFIRLRMDRPNGNLRRVIEADEIIVDLNQSIASQINAWLQRTSHDRQSA